jgi:hypothetical protein
MATGRLAGFFYLSLTGLSRSGKIQNAPRVQAVRFIEQPLVRARQELTSRRCPIRGGFLMNVFRRLFLCGTLVFLVVAGCKPATAPKPAPPAVDLPAIAYRITGPLIHQNLAVFFLCSDKQDDRDFLTLDEGLKKSLVSIKEQEHEQVQELQIENTSDRPLFLQEGERLQGGKQDRIIVASLVVPPKSGKMSVHTMCVEHDRWTEGSRGKTFYFTANAALAPKGVRGAAKVNSDQGEVWACVRGQKAAAIADGYATMEFANSSVNELLDDPKVRTISDDYARALAEVPSDMGGKAVVGAAIVVNNQVEEVNVYLNHALFHKLYPRLIQSYALQAAMLKDKGKVTTPVTTETVASFLRAGEKSKKENSLDSRNKLQVRELDGEGFECTTRYNDAVIHQQVFKKNGKADPARAAALGSDW